MPAAPQFDSVTADQFPELAQMFKARHRRPIDSVHLHHTFVPTQSLFYDLVNELGVEELAGLELCRRMWRYHTQDLGWSDIAQHVTIDPAGRIWLNRSWDRAPASASGFNGSSSLGPFMIEMIGNFDRDQETPTDEQKHATLTVVAAIQKAFDLEPDAFRFHHEMNNQKTCPGDSMDRDAVEEDVTAYHAKTRSTKPEEGPLGEQQTVAFSHVNRLLQRGVDDATGATRALAHAEIAAELDEEQMSVEAIAKLTGRAVSRPGMTRGGGGAAIDLTPAMRRELKPHVINLRQGEFSTGGGFTTSSADAEALVNQHLKTWAEDKIRAQETPRVMIHAHGGLTSEASGLVYAYTMFKWWKSIGVYPIFFVWETGTIESIWQLLEDMLGLTARGFLDDLRDGAIERIVHQLGQDFWNIMKLSAKRASDTGPDFGAHRLAQLLKALHDDLDQKIEIHAVGHSAGAIFQSYFMRECTEGNRRIPVQSLHYLAPACTIDLFKDLVQPRVDGTRIQDFTLYTMDRLTERADPTVPAYGKSLLYLVSRGFERERGEPILGLEDSINDDQDIVDFLGLGAASSPRARVIWSPSGPNVPDNSRAESTTHGGFDNEQHTMTSVALRITGGSDADLIPTVPQTTDLARSGAERLFAPLSARFDRDVYRELFHPPSAAAAAAFPVSTPSPGPVTTAPTAARPTGALIAREGGKRLALCIGIDEYPAPYRLGGCVGDALLWKETLEQFQFEVELLRNEQATYRTLLDTIDAVVGRARAGDVVVIHFSGHGAYFPDESGDEEDDRDETLVPIDFRQGGDSRYLSDDELWTVLQRGDPGAIVTVFMDCCHSASNTRAAPLAQGTRREIHPSQAEIQAHRRRIRQQRARGGPIRKSIEDMKHVKFAACQDNEFAYESDGHGKFTLAAIDALRNGRNRGLSNDAMRLAIEAAFRTDQRQHPHLEARTRDKQGLFLGGILG